MAKAPALVGGFELPAGPRLPRVGSIDAVALEERAATLAKRSIKRESKVQALELAVRMMDLTTLEGQDTHGKRWTSNPRVGGSNPPGRMELALKRRRVSVQSSSRKSLNVHVRFSTPVSTSSQATKDGIHLGREVHAVLGGAVAAVVRVILPTT